MKISLKLAGVMLALLTAAVAIGVATKPSPGEKSTKEIETAGPSCDLKQDAARKKSVTTLDVPASRGIPMYGEVTAQSVGQVLFMLNKMQSDSSEPIYLVIDSPGGSVIDGFKLITAMENSTAPIHTVCAGICASMAAVTFEYGVKRYAQDRSILMFHEAALGAQGYINNVAAQINFLHEYVIKSDKVIAKRVGMPYDKFDLLVKDNLWIDGEQAVQMKFADKLVNLNITGMSQNDPTGPSELKKISVKYRDTLQNKIGQ